MATHADPDHALTPSGNLRRRLVYNALFEGGAGFAAFIAVAVLLLVIVIIAAHGLSTVSWHFLTGTLPPPSGGVGGIGPAIIGTLEMVGLTVAVTLPLAVFIALFVTQFASPRLANAVRTVVDVMNGLPTIVVGVFVFAVFIAATHSGFAGWKGILALSIVILPLITRATIEAVSRVPETLTEAADALGVARWRTVVGVILPTASPSILTATILAAARAGGETAPVLFTNTGFVQTVQLNPLHAMPNMPLEIYLLIATGNPVDIQEAWGTAFVLVLMVLAANLIARAFLRRAQRKRGL
jgi:phosphate transport system permease protein